MDLSELLTYLIADLIPDPQNGYYNLEILYHRYIYIYIHIQKKYIYTYTKHIYIHTMYLTRKEGTGMRETFDSRYSYRDRLCINVIYSVLRNNT